MAKRPLIYDSEDEDEEDELHLAPIARIQETAATTPPVFIDLSASSPLSQPGETVHASTGSTGVFDQLLHLLHKTRLISVAFRRDPQP